MFRLSKILTLSIMAFALMTLLTGCVVMETFGKDYRRIDEFYDQLEADVRFSFNEYFSALNPTSEQKKVMDTELNEISAYLKSAKKEMKSNAKWAREENQYLIEMGLGSSQEYMENKLAETRTEIEQKLEKASGGNLTLKHAEINRGFFGSIWWWIRNHWIITLIMLAVIGAIYEWFENFIGEFMDGKE